MSQKATLEVAIAFEKQMSTIYTHEVFKKFQFEVLGTFGCFSLKETEDGVIATFKVKDLEKNEDFVAIWDVGSKYFFLFMSHV